MRNSNGIETARCCGVEFDVDLSIVIALQLSFPFGHEIGLLPVVSIFVGRPAYKGISRSVKLLCWEARQANALRVVALTLIVFIQIGKIIGSAITFLGERHV